MASPGQRRGNCGHIMAGFDGHKKCARCREKKLGDDSCVKDLVCSICDAFSEQQRSMLSTPQYKIRKDKKSGLLVSPSKITVVGVANQEDLGGEQDEEELDGVPVLASGSGEPQFSISHHTPEDFVSKRDFDTLSNQLEEKFARFEALLTRTNIFSTPKAPVSAVSITTSEQPFFNPSEPGATGPVRPPATDGQNPQVKDKRNKGTGKKLKKTKVAPTATVVSEARAPVKDQTVIESLPAQRHEEPVKVDAPVPGPAPSLIPGAKSTSKPETSFFSSLPDTTTGVSGTGQSFSAEQDVSDVDSNLDLSDKASDEGEISDSEATEQNEEMNYRETCRSVRAFLGWNHIPDFELSVSDGDSSDNLWKGKHPRKTGKVSVELPPDDWLWHKMEKLNCRVAEGYPSRSQESAGLKVDQFIRTRLRVKPNGTNNIDLGRIQPLDQAEPFSAGPTLRPASTPSTLGLLKFHPTLNLVPLPDRYLRTSYAGGRSVLVKGHTLQIKQPPLIGAPVKSRTR